MTTYQITTTIDSLDLTEARSLAIVTNTGAVLNTIQLTSDGNIVSINGYVGSVNTVGFNAIEFESSVDNSVFIGSSGLTNSVEIAGSGNKITNGGSIIAVDHGNADFGYSAVNIGGGRVSTYDNTNYITNSGSIFTSNPDIYVDLGPDSYDIKSYGVVVTNGSDTILNNSGTISATYGHAISLGLGSDTFTNTGTVFGDVELGEGNNVTYNSGAIHGDVLLGGGNNVLRSHTGEIFGTITTGDGNNSIFAPANGGEIVTGGGTDIVRGSEAEDNIATGGGDDRLRGFGDDDVLNGGGGIDVMIGGKGDDTYYIDNPNDILNENKDDGDGEDTAYVVYAGDCNLLTQTRGIFEDLVLIGVTGVEDLNGTGTAADNNITGNGGANQITGLAGNDQLFGGGGADLLNGGKGADILEGGSGADTMVGGADDDVYRIDSTTDIVDETDGSGTDTVLVLTPLVSYSLNNAVHVKGQVENLQFLSYVGVPFSVGTGNDLDNTITGNAGSNKFLGLDGNDVLDGMGGNDTLIGGQGADQFLGGDGTDVADFSGSAAKLTVALDGSVANTGEAAGDTFSSIEVLIGTNAAAGDTLTGDTGANTIKGNAGNDSINGRAGSDDLIGGVGSDTMTGDLGDDRFTYNALAEAGDIITDFSSVSGNNDYFRFDHTVFTGDGVAQPTGPVSSASFITRAADHQAQDGNDFFIYETDTHELWYDPTGSDVAGDAIRIATLQNGATMTRTDIFLF